jgi:hypothetical protein
MKKNELQIPGKGRNVTLKIVNLLEHMMAATDVSDGHVSGNGGTCRFIPSVSLTNKQQYDSLCIS